MQICAAFGSLKKEANYTSAQQANECEQQSRFSLMPADVTGCAEMYFQNAMIAS